MSIKSMKSAASLLVPALMVARAFAPATNVFKPNIAPSGAEIAGDPFPGRTTPAADPSGTAFGTAWHGRGSAEIEDPVGSGGGVLPVAAGSAGDPDDVEMRLVNAAPDLDAFTETFEITARRTVTLDGSEGILAARTRRSGNRNAVRAEWFVREERSQIVEFPVIGYRDVTLEDAIAMGVIPEHTLPEDVAPEDLAPGHANPGVVVRVPCVAGAKTAERSRPEWVPLAPGGRTLRAGETRLFKAVYARPAGIGPAWWSTARLYRVPAAVAGLPSTDGHPCRTVVSFRPGMREDFSDIRFVTGDGTVLDCRREAYTASGSAVIRIGLPAGATSIWMYYGDAFAAGTGGQESACIP